MPQGGEFPIAELGNFRLPTTPKIVREALDLEPGDVVVYQVSKGVVTLKRLETFDGEFHTALSDTLDEWARPEDDEVVGDL